MTNEQKAVNEGIRYANRTPLESVRYEPDSEKMYRAAIRATCSSMPHRMPGVRGEN
jgi:hypothetical protein